MHLLLIALICIPLSSLIMAMNGMWIFNWYAPLISPDLHVSFKQAFGAMAILTSLKMFYIPVKPKQTGDSSFRTVLTEIIFQTACAPFVITAVMGLIYLCCVYPFR